MFEALLSRPQIVLSDQDSYGFTPLMWAACKGHTDLVEALTGSEHSGRINVAAVDIESGFSALHWAVNKMHASLIPGLVAAGSDVNAKCKRSLTPLHWACVIGDVYSAHALVEAGADPSSVDGRMAAPLHIAALKEPEIVRLLLEVGVEVDARTSRGSTGLIEAAAEGQTETVNLLLAAGADAAARDAEGCTGFHYATKYGHIAVLRLLHAAAPRLVNEPNGDGVKPIHLAAFHDRADSILFIKEAGGDLNTTSRSGTTALHVAAAQGNSDVCTTLLNAGADHGAINGSGNTALHYATAASRLSSCRVLIKAGADPHIRNSLGETAIDNCNKAKNDKLGRYLADRAKQFRAEAASAAAGSAPGASGPPTPNRSSSMAAPSGGPIPASAGGSAWEVEYAALEFSQTIGKGSYGNVYVGKWNGSVVAVKQFTVRSMTEKQLNMFAAEVDILASLRHPNVLLFMGACTDSATPLCIVTEYVSGGSLFHALHDKNRSLNWNDKLKCARDSAAGMAYLHSRSIIHRDLKSLNVLVEKDWTCKIADFGLSVVVQGEQMHRTRLGTPQYMAPEVLLKEDYDGKADVYAFSVVLWEILTRRQPFRGLGPMVVARRVVQEGLRPDVPPKTPSPWRSLMEACWANSPADRPDFQTILTLLDAMLESAAASSTITAQMAAAFP